MAILSLVENEYNAPDDSLFELLPSWELSMRARNLSPKTIDAYTLGVRSLNAWCAEQGLPFDLDRRLVQGYLAGSLEAGLAATTLESYLKGIKIFAKWCLAEGEIDANTLAGVLPPRSDEVILPSVSPEQWDAIVATCERDTLRGKRDAAIFGLLRDTGARARELVGIDVGDINLREQTILLHGKGGRDRLVGYSDRTAVALDRYLRARRKSQYAAGNDALLLSVSGPRLSYFGLWRMLTRRSEAAGLAHINPHQFRRMFAHEALDNDMSGGDLKSLAGWRSFTMVEHYTKEHANRRALKSQRRIFQERDG